MTKYTRDYHQVLVDWFNEGLAWSEPDDLLEQARKVCELEGFTFRFPAPLGNELVVEGVRYSDAELRHALQDALNWKEPEA